MKPPNSIFSFTAFALLAMLVGCANQKEPAQQALASAESAIQTVAADAQKYVPARYAELTSSLAATKASFDKGDYKSVLAAAPGLVSQAKALGDEAMTKKDEIVNQLKGDWTSLATSVPNMVSAIQSRVDMLSKSKKLPANLTADTFNSAKSGLDSLKQLWAQASSAFTSGDIASAVSSGKSAQAKGNEVLSLLGMTPS